MKTAMQELIDEIRHYKEKESLGSTSRDWLLLIETIATNKLEKEKEQIMEAYIKFWFDDRGYIWENRREYETIKKQAETHYNQTYNQNK